jgi:uncharacterized SAM-binding protein YcdF (DUF218 family)
MARGQLVTCRGKALTKIAMLKSRAWRWAIFLPGLVCVVVLAGVPVYVRPQIDPLRHADAILILGGYEYDRYRFGLELATEGWAPAVAVSNPNGPRDRWLTEYCATPHSEFELHCFIPDPNTTVGEAQELRRLATEHGWRTVIVVTFRPHISRARFILQQCFDGNLIMAASPPEISVPRWAHEYAYQTAGYLKAVLEPAC